MKEFEEERFALDNNDLILDFEDTRPKYCLDPEEVCELLNQQNRTIKSLNERLARYKKPYVKFLPCTCESEKREYRTDFFGHWYKCKKCGVEGYHAPNKFAAKRAWNDAINTLKEINE